jgi:acyl-CoA synthetase (AMP-forming)/AMP-acid ligase II
MEGIEVAIINDDGIRLPERQIGEITYRSDSLFSGYHKRPDLTEMALSDGWFHSGDLGYLSDGELYVCGRKKDLIIVGGDNIHPEDLETIAGTLPEIHSDSVAAFGVLDENQGTEKIVMLCGLNRPVSEVEKPDIERKLRRRVFAEMEVTLGEIHLVPRNWLVKTQNGKIARTASREKYKKLLQDQTTAEPKP